MIEDDDFLFDLPDLLLLLEDLLALLIIPVVFRCVLDYRIQ
jgi:hypothetical protein